MSGYAPDIHLCLGISIFLCHNMIVKTVHQPFDRMLNQPLCQTFPFHLFYFWVLPAHNYFFFGLNEFEMPKRQAEVYLCVCIKGWLHPCCAYQGEGSAQQSMSPFEWHRSPSWLREQGLKNMSDWDLSVLCHPLVTPGVDVHTADDLVPYQLPSSS